jgi:hypothetical protein
VERLATSEAEKEAAYVVRAGNVGAPATRNSSAPTVGKEKLWIMVMHQDGLEPHNGVSRNEGP